MPSKSSRTRKPANREPTSLAVYSRGTPQPPTLESLPDQLQQVIDPEILALNKAQTDSATAPIYNSITVEADREFSPFSDGYEDQPTTPSLTTPSPSTSDSQKQDIDPEQQDEEELETKFAWTFAMEEVLFNELVHQVELGKRADNGFKKEAWVAAFAAVEAITTQQDITLQRCKNKVESFKKHWRDFNFLQNH